MTETTTPPAAARAAPFALAIALAAGLAAPALAQDAEGPMIVEKRVFAMPEYTTVGGETIRDVEVGWEAYGTLNEAGDNAILITHFFSGTSHAAGKYSPDDPSPGYWDSIIGPGKTIDTNEYYVISSDTLVNLNTGNPNVTTTGPATIDPETGEPYGMDFPIVTIADFVNVQRALLEEIGVTKLQAVMGASMGALQAYEWGASHPDMVERVIAVIGTGYADAFLIGWLDVWAAPIRLDPKWNGGDYDPDDPPIEGLTEALKIVTLHANHWKFVDATYGREPADPANDPAAMMDNPFAVEAWLERTARARAMTSDANHFLYLVKANQLFAAGNGDPIEGLKAIDAPVLVVYAPDDLVFFPEQVRETATLIASDGTPARLVEIAGDLGHLNGVLFINEAATEISRFLESDPAAN